MLKPEHYPLTKLLDLKVNAMTVVGTATGEILTVSFLLLDYATLLKPKIWTPASDYIQVPVTQQLQFYSALDGTLPDQTMETKTYQLKTFRVREGNDALDIKCAFVPELGGWLVRE